MDILIDLTFGDNGKGRMVDYLASDYDVIARFNGGSNAGHTLFLNGIKYVLHIIPSGILHKKPCIIGNGCVFNPIGFKKELDSLNLDYNPLDYIYLSDRAHIITPMDILTDIKKDVGKGIGTTKSGNGVAYSRKAARDGFRVSEIFDKNFEENYIKYYSETVDYDYVEQVPTNDEFLEAINWIKNNVKIEQTEILVNDYIKNGKKVLCEGAQGTLLDIDFGTYPYVTSSSTISASACIGLGVSPKLVDKIYGVIKCYVTRVGNGEFATEIFGATSDRIIELGGEYGSTTGRKRRVGWLDLKDIEYSIMLNGVTDLCITKLDIFSELDTFCVSGLDGKLKEFNSWKTIYDVKGNMKQELIDFINYIEDELKVHVTYTSVGKDRNELLKWI